MANVFILTPGRTGSTTFSKACSHIQNYSVAQEEKSRVIGADRLDYPTQHIEVDSRLIWFLTPLARLYGESAEFVYLRRDPEKVASSYSERWFNNVSVVRAFGEGILMRSRLNKSDRFAVCQQYAYLADEVLMDFVNRHNGMTLNLENIEADFRYFFHRINAQGDLEACIEEFKIKYNPNPNLFLGNARSAARSLVRRLRRNIHGMAS